MIDRKIIEFELCPHCGGIIDHNKKHYWKYMRIVQYEGGEQIWQGSMDQEIWIKL